MASQRENTETAGGLQTLHMLMRRVNTGVGLDAVLHEVATGIVDVLGYGVAAISRREGDTLVMNTVAGPEEVRRQVADRRVPVTAITEGEFANADQWGLLRFVPHQRFPEERIASSWVPDLEPSDDPEAWHPLDALFAPLYSATGELLGNISVDLPPGNRIPDQAQRAVLEMFVAQAGIAMDNALRRAQLEEQVLLTGTLQRVAAAGRLGDLPSTLEAASRAIQERLDVDFVRVRIYSGSENSDDEVATWPPGVARQDDDSRVVLRRLARMSMAEDACIVSTTVDPSGGGRFNEHEQEVVGRLVEGNDGDSGLLAAVTDGADLYGYVVIVRTGQKEWSGAELDIAHRIGRELGRVVRNDQMYHRERALVRELQKVDSYRRELITTISHEFKTPLTTIMGHLELMEELDTGLKSVAAMRRNAERLERLVAHLLVFSRDADALSASAQLIDLVPLVQQSLELVQHAAELGRVAVGLDISEGTVPVSGESEELAKVINNLVHNAVKYTRAGGRVALRVGTDRGDAVVEVVDTGLGISHSDLTSIFEAFRRSTDLEALAIPGTGLGLAISRRIARLHGGDIDVVSEPGQGSTFTLRLPLAAAE